MIMTLSQKFNSDGAFIITLFEGQKPEKKLLTKELLEAIELHLKEKTFKGEAGEILGTHVLAKNKPQKIVLFGLGKEKDWNKKQARNHGAKIIKSAKNLKEKKVCIVVPKKIQSHLSELAEGIILGSYNPVLYKTGDEKKKIEDAEISNVTLVAASWSKNHESQLKRSQLVAEGVNYVRHLVNRGPNMMHTEEFVSEAKKISKEHGHHLTDFDKKQLEKMGMGGILAVNRGSVDPAHLLILEHNAKSKEAPIVIIGKGIIFDTGGVNLKPSASMQDMHLDMAGAAVVLGIFKLLKKLNIKRRVVGITPITDNAIDSKAYRPSEIVTTYSGKTVEIMNTDAEGRMILCDAISYAKEKYKPHCIIDLATLTGACMVALGFRTAGLFGNDEKLLKTIKASAEQTDEPVCELPITDADEKAMKGKLADLTNLAMDHGYAGSSRAAAFLKVFVGDSTWAHIDIAGTAYTKDPKDYEVPMGTGYGVRMMIDVLERLS